MSDDPVHVAEARDVDLEVASGLLVRFFVDEDYGGDDASVRRNLREMMSDAGCHVALAWLNESAVGVVTISTIRYIEWGLQAEIGDLYVLPNYRRRGIGRSLIDTALNWSRGSGCGSVEIVTTQTAESRGAVALYERVGFRPTGRSIQLLVLK